MLSIGFSKGGNFRDLFASLEDKILLKMAYFIRKEFAPRRENSFLYELTFIENGGEN